MYVTNPQAALQQSWMRLQECYATPEVIESDLFKRLDNFPRLFPKDHTKLGKLADLLMELLAAKGDGYLAGLAYLDTPRGINPIVEKWLLLAHDSSMRTRLVFPLSHSSHISFVMKLKPGMILVSSSL